MGKYVIHFDDKPWQDLDDELYYRCKEIPWFSTTRATISRLTPYTEPDIDAIRNEEYEKGVQDTKQHWIDAPRTCAYTLGYENGLNDAWETARTLWNTPNRKEIFGHTTFNIILTTLTAQEAIEKIRQYERGKEEQIQIGDEVIATSGKAVIVGINYDKDKARYIYPDSTLGFDNICNLSKTSRHFPEIAEVLQKMKESDNG